MSKPAGATGGSDATNPGPPPAATLGRRFLAYKWLLLLAALVVIADQLSKAWIARRLPFGTYLEADGAIAVIPGFFNLVHVGNTGAAWSLFTGRSVLLATLAAATLVAIFLGRRALGLRETVAQICFGLLCGGILGNLLDRIRHGHVIDFLDFHFGGYPYPTFNLADSGICVGVVLYLFHSLRNPRP
jgi:signal peptidase II